MIHDFWCVDGLFSYPYCRNPYVLEYFEMDKKYILVWLRSIGLVEDYLGK